ncbi:putative sporulation protein YtxC [Alkaliphilus transvaalensis]|uniref:putative sporulation protein YtxC n=1 Tax=Alkaliphilus transvaalensis TaxID=114628 RepID=UPI00068451A7|nr:putative sporulation protein YtxC [Alkaliphilus transvaalensis]
MNLLLIETNKNAEVLKSKLKKQLKIFEVEGIKLKEEVINKEVSNHIKYSVEIESVKKYPISDFIALFKDHIAKGLWEYIQAVEEINILRKMIDKEYYYFDERERLEIERNAINILKEENRVTLLVSQEDYTRRSKVIKAITEYLSNESQINIDGFITFRLKDYYLELEETIEKAVEDFLMDKEYNEFIKLLKYFVDIQDSKIELIHVVLEEDHSFKLYDFKNEEINNEYLREVANELSNSNFLSYEDLLMSSLITMAPEKIIIHQVGRLRYTTDIIKTILRVFTSKVMVCNGCEWCSVEANLETNVNKE